MRAQVGVVVSLPAMLRSLFSSVFRRRGPAQRFFNFVFESEPLANGARKLTKSLGRKWK